MHLIIDHHVIFGNKPSSNFLPKQHMVGVLKLLTTYVENTADTLCILCRKDLVGMVKESTFMLAFKDNANVMVMPFQQGGPLPTLEKYLPDEPQEVTHFITRDRIAHGQVDNKLGIQAHHMQCAVEDIYPQLAELFKQKLLQTAQLT